ncbi:hypothetical protein [Paenibacillus methanolicus]|uniref:SpoIIAA-like protein n=1 Tax=Paenibacillus methanolicus TaxID=582686 RepID=A0A5S5BY01_9BACL|nr:hypothetical protein [Paenibacillus methanolicus]TYP72031.1 hypothetical protein BCM02_109310 [Paenibacillus methanolicus]
MYSVKSPGGSLYPYYYKGGEIHCLKYGSFYRNKDSLVALMKEEEDFILGKKRRMRIWVDFYKTNVTNEVIAEFVESICRIAPSISKLSIVGCPAFTTWKIRSRLRKVRKSLPLKFFVDPEDAKTWLVSESM